MKLELNEKQAVVFAEVEQLLQEIYATVAYTLAQGVGDGHTAMQLVAESVYALEIINALSPEQNEALMSELTLELGEQGVSLDADMITKPSSKSNKKRGLLN